VFIPFGLTGCPHLFHFILQVTVHPWNDQIIVFAKYGIEVYSISQVESASQLQEEAFDNIEPLHRCSLLSLPSQLFDSWERISFSYGQISKPMVLPDAVCFTFVTGKWIWGIRVPSDLDGPLEMIPLARLPSCVGTGIVKLRYSHTLFIDGLTVYGVSHERWEDGRNKPEATPRLVWEHPVNVRQSYFWLGYAEDTGKMVICRKRRDIVILELV
jgi:hypothetical protein